MNEVILSLSTNEGADKLVPQEAGSTYHQCMAIKQETHSTYLELSLSVAGAIVLGTPGYMALSAICSRNDFSIGSASLAFLPFSGLDLGEHDVWM